MSVLRVGIVGHEAKKFTRQGEEQARTIIRELLADPLTIMVSGHCHLGGIDIWAEEEATKLGRNMFIFPPKRLSWPCYKARNIQIAVNSDVTYSLVVDQLPVEYKGMRFKSCYHCHATDHVKSGGCWTAKHARSLGKPGLIRVIANGC